MTATKDKPMIDELDQQFAKYKPLRTAVECTGNTCTTKGGLRSVFIDYLTAEDGGSHGLMIDRLRTVAAQMEEHRRHLMLRLFPVLAEWRDLGQWRKPTDAQLDALSALVDRFELKGVEVTGTEGSIILIKMGDGVMGDWIHGGITKDGGVHT